MDLNEELNDDRVRKILGLSGSWVVYRKECLERTHTEHRREIVKKDIHEWEDIQNVLTKVLVERRKGMLRKDRTVKGQCRECGGTLVRNTKSETACNKCGLVV